MPSEPSSDNKFLKNATEKLRVAEEFCQPLELSSNTLKEIKVLFLKELQTGLKKKLDVGASVKCIPTYIQRLATECEKGKCFVIEITGSDFYILLLTFTGTKEFKTISEKYVFPEHLLGGDAINITNYMMEYFCRFVKKLSLQLENLPLAISLTLYARQDDASGWRENFNRPTEEIFDNIVEIFQKAIECKSDIKISNYVLVNDTAAVLMNSAWQNNYSKIGLIVEKSCSACYLEQIKHVAWLENSRATIPTIPTMIVNTEWAYFGDNGSLHFMRTSWDLRIDELSAAKAEGKFEKMIAGAYIGSLVYSILLDCIKSGALLEGNVTTALDAANSFPTTYVIDIDSQGPKSYQKTKNILRALGYTNPKNIDCDIVCMICETVTRRSIHLVAAALAGLIDHIGDPYVVVGIEGSICRCCAYYREDLQLKIQELVKPEHKFDIIVPEAGRGCGAALVAFETVKLKKLLKSLPSLITDETALNVRKSCGKKVKLKKYFPSKRNAAISRKIQKC